MKLILTCGLAVGLPQCQHVASKLLEGDAVKKKVIPTTASRVYGQNGSFITSTANTGGISANSLNAPVGVFATSSGVYVADNLNNRTLFFSGTATTATRVYGQLGSFTSNAQNNGGISADSARAPINIYADAGGVYITEGFGVRALYYSGTSTTASRVYGHFGVFTCQVANDNGVCGAGTATANTLNANFGIVADSGGLYIADQLNHRVLYFSGTSTSASRVYGQNGSFTTATSGVANGLNQPYGLALDATGLYVADYNNHRVLYYSGTSTTPSRVYGQNGNFASNTVNNGGTSANSLQLPTSIAIGADGIYICDSGNNRVLYYEGTSTTASRVWGQNDDMTNSSSNNGSVQASASSLKAPASVYLYDDTLYVADYNNHRVLAFVGQ